MLCKTTLLEEPWNGGRLAEAIALVLDDDPDFDGRHEQMHRENGEVELSEPCIRRRQKQFATNGTGSG